LGNVIPELSVRLHTFLKDQETEKVKELANHLTPFALFMDSLTGGQYIAALKHMLSRFGVCAKTVRPPLIPLNDSEVEQLEQLSKNLKAAVASSKS
jgi:dihydrodipicolinate synthase/N-acetylneuraminate lyase